MRFSSIPQALANSAELRKPAFFLACFIRVAINSRRSLVLLLSVMVTISVIRLDRTIRFAINVSVEYSINETKSEKKGMFEITFVRHFLYEGAIYA